MEPGAQRRSPDTIAQASEYLTMLIGNLKLTPDPEAEGGLALDVATDVPALHEAVG